MLLRDKIHVIFVFRYVIKIEILEICDWNFSVLVPEGHS